MGKAVGVTQLPITITSGLNQAQLLTALQQNFDALVQGLQRTQGYINNSVAPAINLSSIANSEILGSQIAGFSRPSPAYTEEGVAVGTHIPRYEQIDQNDWFYGLLMEEGTTNLLTANQSSMETDLTGFSAWGATTNPTLTRDTSTAWTGTASAKAVAVGNGSFNIYTNTIAVSPSLPYAFSTYVKGLAAVGRTVQIKLNWYNSGTLLSLISDDYILTSSWQKISLAGISPGNANGCILQVVVINGLTNEILWIDGLQLEQKAYATSWILGGTTRSPETMIIPTAGILTPGNWTVEFVFKPTSVMNAGGNKGLLAIDIDGNNYYHLFVDVTGALRFHVASGGTQYQADSGAGFITQGSTYVIMISCNGSTMLTCCNGNQIRSSSYIEPVGALPTFFYAGSLTGGTTPANGIIDDLRISNVARTITDHKNYISSNRPLPVDADTTLKMDFDQTLRQTSVQRLTNIQGTFVVADGLTTSDASKATHIVPSGWTTAEATIMQAMSELPATGGSITLLDGTFWVDDSTTIPTSNISLYGQGQATVITSSVYVNTAIQDNSALMNTGINLSNIVVQSTHFIRPIAFNTVSGGSITNVTAGAINLAGNNNIITGCTAHIYITSNNNTISNNQCNNFQGSGIETDGSYNTISNNQCNNNATYGIYLSNGANHNNLSGNGCSGNGTLTNNHYSNIALFNASYNTIQGNTCREGSNSNKPNYGIWVSNSGCTSNLISSNDCYTSGLTAGISDAGTSTNFGSGNRVNSGAWSTTPS